MRKRSTSVVEYLSDLASRAGIDSDLILGDWERTRTTNPDAIDRFREQADLVERGILFHQFVVRCGAAYQGKKMPARNRIPVTIQWPIITPEVTSLPS